MEIKNDRHPSASPQEVAGKIAALHGETPSKLGSVKMVGSQEVEQFVGRILDAQKDAGKLVLSLD